MTKTLSIKTNVTNVKFAVEIFDRTNDFRMWQCEHQQDLDVALEEKLDDIDDKEWARINCEACSSICSCLVKAQKYSIMKEASAKILWKTLEDKYMTKSLEN